MKKIVRMVVDRELDIAFVNIAVPVRYDEEDMPSDYPFRKNEFWRVLVDADTGQIQGWPKDYTKPLDLEMKVTDCGSYSLWDREENLLASIDQDYVPHGVVPGSYGDYIKLNIDGSGRILNWPKSFCLDEFFRTD